MSDVQPNANRPVAGRPAQRWPRIWGPRMGGLLALCVVIMGYRMWLIHHCQLSLFFDEAQYWDWSRQLDWGYFSKPPLIALMVRMSTLIAGDGALGVKALCMWMFPLCALSMVGLARALWPTSGGVRTGMLAACLFICSPLAALAGLFATTDAPLVLCWSLASWALWRAQVTDRLKYWLALGVTLGVGCMSKYTMAAFLLTMIWTLWSVHGPRRGLARPGPWLSLLVAIAILGPNLAWNAQHGYLTLAHTAELTLHSRRSGGAVTMLQFLSGQFLMWGPVICLALPLAWLSANRRRPSDASRSMWPHSLAASSRLHASGNSVPAGGEASSAQAAAPSSAYHLASVTSYRYLAAVSCPLLAIAAVQAAFAGANLNWAAPATIGFCMWVAALLSPPLLPLAAPRPNALAVALMVSNLVLSSVAIHAHDVLGERLPHRLDVLWRMRGWHEAFAQLEPSLRAPEVQGLPVLTDRRQLIAQAAYQWRDLGVRTLYWNPQHLQSNHYQVNASLPDRIGADMLFVTQEAHPIAVLSRFANVSPLRSVHVQVDADRSVDLHLYFLRGFLGYTDQSYIDQSGGGNALVPMTTP